MLQGAVRHLRVIALLEGKPWCWGTLWVVPIGFFTEAASFLQGTVPKKVWYPLPCP